MRFTLPDNKTEHQTQVFSHIFKGKANEILLLRFDNSVKAITLLFMYIPINFKMLQIPIKIVRLCCLKARNLMVLNCCNFLMGHSIILISTPPMDEIFGEGLQKLFLKGVAVSTPLILGIFLRGVRKMGYF